MHKLLQFIYIWKPCKNNRMRCTNCYSSYTSENHVKITKCRQNNKFVSDLRQVGGFLQVLRFLHQPPEIQNEGFIDLCLHQYNCRSMYKPGIWPSLRCFLNFKNLVFKLLVLTVYWYLLSLSLKLYTHSIYLVNLFEFSLS